MKSILMKISWIKIILYTIVIVFISLIYQNIARNVLSENLLNDVLYKILFVDFDEIGSIWSAQYTIGVISIGIVSLILANINTKKFGYTITEAIIIEETRFKLKYWDMVVFVIILSLFGMYFVTHKSLEGVTILFIVSGILVICILIQSLNIMLNAKEYKVNEIKKYIIDNVKKYVSEENYKSRKHNSYEGIKKFEQERDKSIVTILDKIHYHCVELLNINDTTAFIKNIELYIELMNIDFYKNNKERNKIRQEKLIETLKLHIYTICKQMIKNGNIKELKIVIEKINNKKENIYESDILIGNIIVILVDNFKYMKELESLEEYGLYKHVLEVVKNDINKITDNGYGYYLDEKTKVILEKIYINTLELIKVENINQANKNIDLYFKLLSKEVYIKDDELEYNKFTAKKNKLENIIKIYIINLIKLFIENNYIQNIKDIIEKLIDKKDEIILAEVIIREILISLTSSMRYINDLKLLELYNIYQYIYTLKIENEVKVELLERYYDSIKKNIYLNDIEKSVAINLFIEFISKKYSNCLIRLSDSQDNYYEEEYEISKKIALFIGRESILNASENDLIELIYTLNENCRILDQREYYTYAKEDKSYIYRVNELFAVLNVYAYYLIQVEESVNSDFKVKLNKILESYKKDQSTNKYSLNQMIIDSMGEYLYYYDSIYKLMNSISWEFMQLNTIKDVKIENSIIEFFVYYGVVFINHMNINIFMDNIKYFDNEENLITWINYFNSDGEIKNKEAMSRFCKINSVEDKDNYNGKELYKYLMEKYKGCFIQNVKRRDLKKEYIKDVETKINNEIKAQENYNLFRIGKHHPSIILNNRTYYIESIALSEINQDYNIKSISKKICNDLSKEIYLNLEKYSEAVDVNYKDINSIEYIIKIIKNTELKLDKCINGKLSENPFINQLLHTSESNKIDIEDIDKNIKKIGNYIPYNRLMYIDSSKCDLGLLIDDVIIEEYSDEDIEKELDKNEQFIINYNGKGINLNRDEMKLYIKKSKLKLNVHYYIKSNIEKKCGYTININ